MKTNIILAIGIILSLQCAARVKNNTRDRWGITREQYDSVLYKPYRKYVIVYKDHFCALYNRRSKKYVTEFLYKSLDLGKRRKSLSDGYVYDFTYSVESGRMGGIVVKDNSIIDGWMSPNF